MSTTTNTPGNGLFKRIDVLGVTPHKAFEGPSASWRFQDGDGKTHVCVIIGTDKAALVAAAERLAPGFPIVFERVYDLVPMLRTNVHADDDL